MARGQGDEGTHDAWSKIPYSRLTEARLISVTAGAKGFEFTGEGAGVYEPALGLTQFQRTLKYADGKLTVSDSIASSKPDVFTEMLHSDTKIVKLGDAKYDLPVAGATLHVELESPAERMTKVESNVVMGPGAPGSVDKGTPEARGERLAVTTDKAQTAATFKWLLTF